MLMNIEIFYFLTYFKLIFQETCIDLHKVYLLKWTI